MDAEPVESLEIDRVEIVIDDEHIDRVELYLLDRNGQRLEGGTFSKAAFMDHVLEFYNLNY